MLVAFSGLPGTGKSTIARLVAEAMAAAYLRVDTLEQALVSTGLARKTADIGSAGYATACALASDMLRIGVSVVSDCVNPFQRTRAMWRQAAHSAGRICLEVEVICSDQAEHRRRVETRVSDIPGLILPDWEQVRERARSYERWDSLPLTVDSAMLEAAEAAQLIVRQAGIAQRSRLRGTLSTTRHPVRIISR